MKFDSQFVDTIQSKKKFETLRVPDESFPKVGETVVATTDTNEKIGMIKIIDKHTMTVSEILSQNFESHQNYESLEEFNQHISEFYSTRFTESDEFTYFRFKYIGNKNI